MSKGTGTAAVQIEKDVAEKVATEEVAEKDAEEVSTEENVEAKENSNSETDITFPEKNVVEEEAGELDEASANEGLKAKKGKQITEVKDLPGIGTQAAEKLFAAGYKTLETVAVSSPMELIEVASLGEITATKAIKAAREALEMGYESADKIQERRKTIGKITTGSEELDTLVGGGIETQSITEIYGKMSCGKTQLCFQTSVTVQLPEDKGGLGGAVVYIDSENSFRPNRVADIAKYHGLEPDKVLKNIFVARAFNADHQTLLAEKVTEMVKEKNVKLVVVDSLTAQFRSEYIGRGKLADRQQKLNRHMRTLMKLAEMHNIAVLVTNQVMSRPDIMFGDPTAPIGGNIVGHASKSRLYLRKSKEDKRVARLVDAVDLPEGEAVFRVTPNGVEDV